MTKQRTQEQVKDNPELLLLVGRLFTDKKYIKDDNYKTMLQHLTFGSDLSGKWHTKTSSFSDPVQMSTSSLEDKYIGSTRVRAETCFEGTRAVILQEFHNYKYHAYGDNITNYHPEDLGLQERLEFDLCTIKTEKAGKKLVIEGRDSFDLRREIFEKLRHQKSLKSYLDSFVLNQNEDDEESLLIKVNGRKYEIKTENLKRTPYVSPANEDKEKPWVDTFYAVRSPPDEFWQPYKAKVMLSEYRHNHGECLRKIRFFAITEELKRLNENNLYGLQVFFETDDDYEKIDRAYLGINKLETHQHADALIGGIKRLQARERAIGERVRQLEKLPYNQVMKILAGKSK